MKLIFLVSAQHETQHEAQQIKAYPSTFHWLDTICELSAGIDHHPEFLIDCRLLSQKPSLTRK